MADQKEAQLVRGSSSVISLLNKLLPTQHSPESFVVDVAISLVISFLSLSLLCIFACRSWLLNLGYSHPLPCRWLWDPWESYSI